MHAKNPSIFCTELKSVPFWLLCLNLVAMATPLALEILDGIFEVDDPRQPDY